MYPFIDPEDFTYLRQSNLMGGYGGGYPDYSGGMGQAQTYQGPMDTGSEYEDLSYLQPPTVPPPPVPSLNYQSGIQPPRPPQRNIMDVYNQLYTPSNTAMDAYTDILNQYPQRTKPSLGRTIAASMIAGSNPKLAQEEMDEPRRRALADWSAQVTPRYNAASLENQRNINERQLAAGTATNIVNQERYEEQARNTQEKNEISRIRSLAYQYKVEHPDWKITAPKGGFITAYNPQNPKETEVLKDEFGKPLSTGTSTDADLADINNKEKTKVAEIAAGASTERSIANEPIYTINGLPYTRNPKTGHFVPVTVEGQPQFTSDKPPTINRVGTPPRPTAPGAQKNMGKWDEAASKLYNTTKAGRDWIIPPTSPGGHYGLKPLGMWASDMDKKVHDDIARRIYESDQTTQGPTSATVGQPQQEQNIGQAQLVPSPDGQIILPPPKYPGVTPQVARHKDGSYAISYDGEHWVPFTPTFRK